MSSIVAAPPRPHRHVLPPNDGVLENSVAACDCGALFVARWCSDSWGDPCWHPLRWWHFKARRLLRQAAEDAKGCAQ